MVLDHRIIQVVVRIGVSLFNTVEPLLTDTPCKRTPLVSGHHFEVPAVSLRKPYICNLP